ncbi:MAG: HEPN domain-containing protein [Acidobacteria bacterium]|nr:HEPN domain-containing protein [Acidobacteriota bacterium]
MTAPPYEPDDPREWLRRARSNLAIAQAKPAGVCLEDLCFELEQAVEKAVKAVLISRQIEFPYTHDLARLVALLVEVGATVPHFLREAERLTPYATFTRYPYRGEPVSEDEYGHALSLAEATIHWAEGQILGEAETSS